MATLVKEIWIISRSFLKLECSTSIPSDLIQVGILLSKLDFSRLETFYSKSIDVNNSILVGF